MAGNPTSDTTPATLAELAKPCVYLICFHAMPLPLGYRGSRHFLGVSPYLIQDLRQLDTGRLPHVGRQAVIQAIEKGADLHLVDIWPCESLVEAVRLRQRMHKAGGGTRACSVCRPGNGFGGGRGVHRYQLAKVRKALGLPHAGTEPSAKQKLTKAEGRPSNERK